VVRAVQHPERELALFAALLGRLEDAHFTSTCLIALRSELESAGESPSRAIGRLHRLVHLLDARKNQLFGPLAALLLWTTQLALALEAWRIRHGTAIARWLATIGKVEALSALASYAYEHPDDPFPELSDATCFDGQGLGHPLLPEARCVRNDLR